MKLSKEVTSGNVVEEAIKERRGENKKRPKPSSVTTRSSHSSESNVRHMGDVHVDLSTKSLNNDIIWTNV